MKDKLMNSLKRRRKRKDRYERLSNESLEKRLAFNTAPILTDADLQLETFESGYVRRAYNRDWQTSGYDFVWQIEPDAGVYVSSLIDTVGQNGNFFDAEGDGPGIAITDINLEGGQLFYSLNNGEDWFPLNQASMEYAKLLRADNQTKLYYSSEPYFTGNIDDLITFRAWDGNVFDNGTVLDVSQPLTPTLIESLEGAFSDLNKMQFSSDGRFGYLVTPTGLQKTDWSDPLNPELIKVFDNIKGMRLALGKDEQFAYVVNNWGALLVIDMQGGSAPAVLSQYASERTAETGTAAPQMTLSDDGRYLYLATHNYGFEVIDLIDPLQPTKVGSFIEEGNWTPFLKLSADGRYAFIGGSSLRIVDLNDPENPQRISTWGLGLSLPTVPRGFTISSDQTTAFVNGNDGFSVVDINDPTRPDVKASIKGSQSRKQHIAIASDNLVVSYDDGGNFDIIDVSNDWHPKLVGTYQVSDLLFNGLHRPQSDAQIVRITANNQLNVIDVGTGQFSSQTDTVSVSNVFGSPLNSIRSTLQISENQPVDTVIVEFPVTHGVSGALLQYSLVSGEGDTDNHHFSLVQHELRSGAIFDHESQQSLSIRVRATDENSISSEKIFTIAVGDVNDTPIELKASPLEVSENAAIGTVVAYLDAIDPDSNDTFKYKLASGFGDIHNDFFEIVGNELRTATSFDYESQQSLSIRVRVTDRQNGSFEKTFIVPVRDVNEVPKDLTASVFDVTANSLVGSVVARLGANDQDLGDVLSYSLVVGDGDADNDLFEIVGNELRTASNFDYESQPYFSVRVRATDLSGLAVEQSFKRIVGHGNTYPVLTDVELQLPVIISTLPPEGDVGVLVSSLIDSGGANNNYFDAESDLPGIAITGINLAGNSLYYTIDGGSNWHKVESVSRDSALLLKADNETRIAVVSSENFTEEFENAIRFRAWDRSNFSTWHNEGFKNGGYSNLSWLLAPETLSSYSSPYGTLRDAVWSNDQQLVFVATHNGFDVIDVGNPWHIEVLGNFRSDGIGERRLAVSPNGKLLYMVTGGHTLQIFDVSDSGKPQFVSNLSVPRSSLNRSSFDLSPDGRYLYLAGGESGLHVVDVSSPHQPKHVQSYETQGFASNVKVTADSKTVYVTNGTRYGGVSGLEIFTAGWGGRINSSYFHEIAGEATSVTLSSNHRYAYVGTESHGLQIIDTRIITNPTEFFDFTIRTNTPPSPVIGRIRGTGSIQDISLSPNEKSLFIVTDRSGLIVDVTEPNRIGTLSVVGYKSFFNHGATSGSISPDGTRAIIPTSYEGLLIVDLMTGPFSFDSDSITLVPPFVNSRPDGSVIIVGPPTEGQTLIAFNNLADENKLGDITYQWNSDGHAFNETHKNTYTLTQADVGASITVTVNYTDGQGTAESVTSDPTTTVLYVNNAPSGVVTINGIAVENQTLTATNNLVDEDGVGDISYQWKRNAVAITGAVADTYVLTQADVGAVITVTANYLDGQGTAESVTSDPTLPVVETNNRPSLVVTPSITMTDDAVGSDLPSSTSGVAVSGIIDAGGVLNNFSDQDEDSAGIAITGTQLDGGMLWFSTDSGATWTDVGDVAEHSARVLVADENTKLYFQTSTDSAPALEEVFTFKAWDLTGGWTNGDSKVNASQVTALTSDDTSGIHDGPTFNSPHYASGIKMSPDGRLAYVLDPTLGVHIFDVSTPNEIIRLTDYLASGDVNDITFSSDSHYAFIAMGDGGVQIVDISTPSSPVLETTIVTDGEALAVELDPDDEKLFVALGASGVAVYDISSVKSPSIIHSFSTGGNAVNLLVETLKPDFDSSNSLPTNYLFVTESDGTVAVFGGLVDEVVTSGIRPPSYYLLQELDLGGFAYDVTMSADGHLLVAGGDGGLHLIELAWQNVAQSAPLINVRPRYEPHFSLVSTVELSGRAYSVEASDDGRYAMVSGNETGVHAVDISKPDSPSIAWSWNTPGQAYGTAVSADGRFLFVADGDQGIRSQGISFLNNIRSLSTEAAVTQTVFSADGQRAYSIARDYLYVNALSSDGEWRNLHKCLLYWDQPDGITDVPNIKTNARSICLSPSEDHLFVNLHKNGNGSRILTLSLTDSEEPVEISRKAGAPGGYTISQDGRFLLAGGGHQKSNLFVYDITAPAELELVERTGFSNLGSGSLNRSIVSSDDGSIIYTASERYGLSVYDASNITDIKLLGRYDPHLLDSDDLALSNDGKYIFITGGPDGLHIVDVQDPTNPSVISKIDTPANALAVTLSADGRYAFVADGISGTHVIDVQNLTAPKLIGQIYSSANAKNVEMSADGKTLVVSGDEGIQFISMESSTSFSTESDVVGTLMNSAPTSITATGTVIAENSAVGTVAGYLTVTDADAGDSVTFTLVQGQGDDDNDAFEISGSEIRVTKILDYEAQRDYTIRVRATDSAGAFKEERIQLAVTDVVETPTGTPLILTAAEGVISIDAEITFDPTKIDLQRVDVADGLPQGAIATVNVVSPGRALFGVSLPGALGDRPYVLGYLKANLVGDETGAPEDLLVMSNVRFNEGNISSTSPVGIDLLRVGNAAPTLITITSTTVSEGSNVGTAIGSFSTADADAGDLMFYELVSGQGGIDNAKFTIENGTLKTKVRLDYETATSHSIRVRATDAAGEFVEQAFTVSVEDVADGLSVVSVTPSSSGLKIEFSEALDTSELNVLSTPGFSGGSDIQLLGSTTGFVKGSLVVSADLQAIDFVATGGMAEDTYTLIVSSGVNGFKAQSGALLDGNADGVTGDNYLSFIDLTSAPQAIVGIESFARAPGEQVSASLESDGVLNLNVETTETVSSIDFTLSFNPELLDIEAVNLGGEAPAGATVTHSVVAPGEIAVQFRSNTPLQAGVANFVAIDAGVVAEATYGEVGLLEVKNVNVNAGSVTSGGKSGVQVVAKLGDANGDANHSTIDSILAANLATRPNRGLASYPLIDPSVVTDVSGSGENTMFDSALIATANRVEDVMGPTVERSVDSENPRRLLYRQDGEYGSVTLPRLQGVMAARASAFIEYSLGSNPQAQALFASYGADMESSDDDNDNKNWLPDPGMIGSGG